MPEMLILALEWCTLCDSSLNCRTASGFRGSIRLVRHRLFGAEEHIRIERGFALISQRTESMQRMYFQCDPDEDVHGWSEDRIWTELQARVGANGH